MSQSDTADQSGKNSQLTDVTDDVADRLESLDESDVETLSDVDLVELRTAVKRLEDAVEEVRKQQVDVVLKDRISPGDTMLGLSHIESHNKYVVDDVGTVIGRLANRGVDYTEYVSLDATALAELDDDVAEIGRAEYTYLR